MSAPPGARPDARRWPVDASMTLLNEVMHRPLDPGYAEAAARRRRGEAPAARPARTVLLLAVAAGLGLAVTSAAAALRVPHPDAVQARSLLTEQISAQTTRAAALQQANDAATREIADLRTQALAAQDQGLLAVLARDELAAGTAPVAGPGLQLTLTDAPVAQADPEAADPDLRVQDVDLQVVANGLWAAGAEAIAINGQRLTALTAIRSAGSAILVDLAPLSGPYVVEAIGDPNPMQTAFARTSAGQHLSTLRNTYGIASHISAEDRLELPGSPRTRLQSAAPLVPAGSDDETAATPGRAPDAVQDDPSDVASSRPTEGGTS